MKTRTRIVTIIGAAVVASLLLMVGAYNVFAATNNDSQKYPPIVEKLVQTFHLDRGKVDQVLKDFKQEHEAEFKARQEERLNQAVKDGKITEKQKAAILKKIDELKAKREDLRNLSPEDRRKAFEKERTDLEVWAKENGLDLKQLMFLFGPGRGHGGFGRGFGGPGPGFKGFGGHWGPPADTSMPPADMPPVDNAGPSSQL